MRRRVCGVLLAAGFSHRFSNRDKRCARLRNGSLLALACARNLIRALPHSYAVVRPRDHRLIGPLQRMGFRLVLNPSAREGLSTSVVAAVRAAPRDSALLFMQADMPRVQSATIRRLIVPLAGGAPIVRPYLYRSPANPVAFGRWHRPALIGLQGDKGARPLIPAGRGRVTRVATIDRGVRIDIDRSTDPLLLPGP